MKQIYIEWRDAKAKSHYTKEEGEKPASVLLRGTPWLLEETKTDLLVAAYIADDGGFMDVVAIPKACVETQRDA